MFGSPIMSWILSQQTSTPSPTPAPAPSPTPTPAPGWGTATVTLTGNTPEPGFPLAWAFDGNAGTDLRFNDNGNNMGDPPGTGTTPAELTFVFTGSGNVRQLRLRRSATFGSAANFAGAAALLYSTDGVSWTQKGTTAVFWETPPDAGQEISLDFGTAGGTPGFWRVRLWSPFGNRMGFAEIVLAETVGGPQVVVLA